MGIFSRLSLRGLKLGVITLATFSLTLPGLAWLLDLRTAQEKVVYAKQTARLMQGAAPLLANALIVGDFATAEQTLAQLNRDGFFVHLKLLEADGRTLLMEAPRKTHAEETVPLWFDRLFGADLAPQQSSIQAGGQHYGVLFAQPDRVELTRDLWLEFRYLLLGTCVLNGLLLLVVGGVLTRGFRPIQQLGKTAERLGAGDLGARMPPTALPELSPTVRAFNSMADSIGTLMSEVHSQASSNRKLAALVAQTDEAILSLDNDMRISS